MKDTKDSADDKDYALPPPLHDYSRKLAPTSTPKTGSPDTEATLDREIDELEKSIRDMEEHVFEVEQKKRIKEKEDSVNKPKKQLQQKET